MESAPPSSASRKALFTALGPRYRVAQELGRGGMATVYLAEDTRHRRHVALKVLRPEIASSISTQRFLREIEIAARLTHPHIVPLYDSGEVDGQLYYVMPYVEGKSLRELMNGAGLLPTQQAVSIARQVADALQYAHAQDVVHRDIKPENILISAGQAVVSDFGIARAMREATNDRLTSTEIAIGTPAYMSPEQGTPGASVDGRSDIYSLGVVLHEMLNGRLPAAHSRGGRASRTSMRQLRRKTGVDPVPAHVQAAIRRATALDPGERFESASEFAAALGRPVLSPRIRAGAWTALVAIGALAAFWRFQPRGSNDSVVARRVVVAPFANNTGDPGLDYLGVMAADWVTEGLQRTGILDVVPTSAAVPVARFLDSERVRNRTSNDLGALSRETGAAVVVTGWFERTGSRLQLHAQVNDARRAIVLGGVGPVATTIDSATTAMEQVRSRVMSLLAMHVDEHLRAAAETPSQPPTFESYREFTAGLESYLKNQYGVAATHFAEAFRLDSSMVSALLMQSIAISNQGLYQRADSLLGLLESRRAKLSAYDLRWVDYRRKLARGDRPGALHAVRAIAQTIPRTKATFNLGVEAYQNGYLSEAESAFVALPPDRPPMAGWIVYWDVLSRARHLQGETRAELRDGTAARRAFPGRATALRGSIRALAARNDVSGMQSLVDSAEHFTTDSLPFGAADLALEGAAELRAHGNADAARGLAAHAVALYENIAKRRPLTVSERFNYAQALYELHDWKRAAAAAQPTGAEGLRLGDFLGVQGAAAIHDSDAATAATAGRALLAIPRAYNAGIATFGLARLAAVRGDRLRAVELLRQSLAEGHEYDLWVHRDPDFAALRGYKPYDDLIAPKR